MPEGARARRSLPTRRHRTNRTPPGPLVSARPSAGPFPPSSSPCAACRHFTVPSVSAPSMRLHHSCPHKSFRQVSLCVGAFLALEGQAHAERKRVGGAVSREECLREAMGIPKDGGADRAKYMKVPLTCTRNACLPCVCPLRTHLTGARSCATGPVQEYLIAGSIAGVVSRTCIAPIERVKILFQISKASSAGRRGYRKYSECVREATHHTHAM